MNLSQGNQKMEIEDNHNYQHNNDEDQIIWAKSISKSSFIINLNFKFTLNLKI